MNFGPESVAECNSVPRESELQEQLYRYAEDLHQLMGEHDALQHRFRALDRAHRSVSEYRDLLSTLMHSASEAYFATGPDGRIRCCSASANLVLGRENIVGIPLLEMVQPSSQADAEAMIEAAFSSKQQSEALRVIRFGLPGDSYVVAQVRVIVPAVHAHKERLCHWVMRPLTDGKHLVVDQEEVGSDQASEAIFVTDRDGGVLAVNPAFSRVSGYSPDEAMGMTLDSLKTGAQGEMFRKLFREQLLEFGSWQGEISNRRKTGEVYPEWLSITGARGMDGEIVGYFAKFHDLSRLHESEKHLSRLAYYDVLTGLPNRNLFNDRLRMAMSQSRRTNLRMGLFFIDLDRFKQVNDSLGHEVGDELLKTVAQRLKSVTREVDTVARLGGDEFTVILPNLLDDRDALLVAEKIIDAFLPPVQIGVNQLMAAPSIGIALFPNHGEDESTLLRHADAAMYHAKSDGGNTYRVFELSDEGDTQALNIESAFRTALERNELSLVYQPQVSASGCEILGVEALLRWHNPDFGEVPPDTFIPIAEWSGSIIEIGRWVIHAACQQMALWRQSGLSIRRVAVNISPRQLRDANFTSVVFDELALAGLPGSALELEITESELMLYPESTLLKLADLRAQGVSIAIDDFGTGYSNLARLRELPIDRIKVDRSFVHNLEGDSNAQAISTCIVTMAKVMNLEVVAEGVETAGQLRQLLQQGCHSIQGYLFAKPMLPESIDGWIGDMGLHDGEKHVA